MFNFRIPVILWMMLTATVLASGQNISVVGDIQDGFLKTPLTGARVSLLDESKAEISDSLTLTDIVDKRGKGYTRYRAEAPARKGTYWIRVTLDGYRDFWQRVAVDDPGKGEVTVPMISMLRTGPNTLDEVTVKATHVKMFYRGDTLVYDASAFRLPDGSMLDNLIRQLPGAELRDDGEIFINGRKIDELMLGSRSFMRGKRKVLMENLPYYTVGSLKVYERESDLSRALGHEAGPKSYVMDVDLKQEYKVGYIANIEAAGGTDRRWLGRGFLLGFTDRWRLTLLGNANNVNETRNIGESGYWTPSAMPTDMTTTRSTAGEADYASVGGSVKNNLFAEYRHLTASTDMRQLRETFVQGLTPRSFTENSSKNKSYSAAVRNQFTLLKPFYLSAQGEFKHERAHGGGRREFSQWGDTLTARMLTATLDRSLTTTAMLSADAIASVNKKRKQDAGFSLLAMHYDSRTERGDLNLLERGSARERLCNSDDILDLTNEIRASANYSQTLGRGWGIRSSGGYAVRHTRAHDWLYRPDTISLPSQLPALAATADPSNSYRYRYTRHTESVSLAFVNYMLRELAPGVNISSERLSVKFDIPLMQQRLHYQRGALDTVATHNSFRVNPSADFKQKFGKGGRHELRASASLATLDLDLVQTVGYRDDSRPLVVMLGNPRLKSRRVSAWRLEYYNHNGPGKREISVLTHLDYDHRDVAQSVCYAPATGVYTYRPINVRGAYKWHSSLNYSRSLDRARLWSVQSNAACTLLHSVDHTMLSDALESGLNIVNTSALAERLYVQFNKGSLNLRATVDVKWRRSTGKMADFQTLNATDFQYGLSARYTVPALNTTLAADGNVYSRRGYGTKSLNTDDFVLNASVSQPLMKGALIARLEAFDLLHRLSQTRYEVNAQGRVETWYRSLPHYIMLHLAWHLNINPKK